MSAVRSPTLSAMGFGFGIALTDAQQDRADEVAALATGVLPSPGMIVLCLRCGLARVGVTRVRGGLQLTCTRCGQSVELEHAPWPKMDDDDFDWERQAPPS